MNELKPFQLFMKHASDLHSHYFHLVSTLRMDPVKADLRWLVNGSDVARYVCFRQNINTLVLPIKNVAPNSVLTCVGWLYSHVCNYRVNLTESIPFIQEPQILSLEPQFQLDGQINVACTIQDVNGNARAVRWIVDHVVVLESPITSSRTYKCALHNTKGNHTLHVQLLTKSGFVVTRSIPLRR
ncbi:hypothetical protein [Ranid herpesvirus 3]|uniref:Ig-like domain-containing protein n=1 Tax=Ranid herpesvirus 3 TaxID=1987509 RepID=A0A1X9T584_9VIRU|nr:hypothetical protein [Ranid herpesvirus 3]ARR28856.1 hypothetical protein [Ranid herpesvirus 3]